MADSVYLNFDLTIQHLGDGYRVQVQSPAGEAATTFDNPFSELELENFLLSATPGRRSTRRIDTPEVASAKRFGERLFGSVFSGEVLGLLRDNMNDAWHQESKLRIRLRLNDAPELADLPWEYLYNSTLNRFLALDDDTAIVRYLDMPERTRAVAVSLPLRVLVMVSGPNDFPQLDIEQEWAGLNEALGDLIRSGLVVLDLLEDATLPALRLQLQKGQYHIFHFIGHGGFDRQSEEGVVILKDESGRGRAVSGQQLGWMLHNHRTLSLAIINACEGARADRTDAYAGTAQSLVQQGIPAVVAMQFEITDEAAKSFAHAFYSSISDGRTVEAALTETRLALFAEGHGLEWGTPVLYMRSPDGRIFDLKRDPAFEQAQAAITTLRAAAQAATTAENWREAAGKWQELLTLKPADPEATQALDKARQQAQILDAFAQGKAAYEAGRWTDALGLFRQVQAIDSGYANIAALIVDAERQSAGAARAQEKKELTRQAQSAGAAGDWALAAEKWQKILDEEPHSFEAENGLRVAEQRQELNALLAQGKAAYDAGRWSDALSLFRQAENADSGYGDVGALITQVEQRLTEERTRSQAQQRDDESRRADETRRAAEQKRAEELRQAQEERDRAREAEEKRQASEQALAQASRGAATTASPQAGAEVQAITPAVEPIIAKAAPLIEATAAKESQSSNELTTKADPTSTLIKSAPTATPAPPPLISWRTMLRYTLTVAILIGTPLFTISILADTTASDALSSDTYHVVRIVEWIFIFAFNAGLYFTLGRWVSLRSEEKSLAVALGTALVGLLFEPVPAIVLFPGSSPNLAELAGAYLVLVAIGLVLFTPFAYLGYRRGNKLRLVHDRARAATEQPGPEAAAAVAGAPASGAGAATVLEQVSEQVSEQPAPARRQWIAAGVTGGALLLLTLLTLPPDDGSLLHYAFANFIENNDSVAQVFAVVTFLASSATAGLLLAQFRQSKQPGVAVLGGAFLFCALVILLNGASHVVSPLSDLSLIYGTDNVLLWAYPQMAFVVGTLGYAWLGSTQAGEPGGRDAGTILKWVLLAVGGLFVVAVLVLLLQPRYGFAFEKTIMDAVWLLQLVALGALVFRRRGRTALDLWLTVAMLASLLSLTVTMSKRSTEQLPFVLGIDQYGPAFAFGIAHLDSLVAAAALLVLLSAQGLQGRKRA